MIVTRTVVSNNDADEETLLQSLEEISTPQMTIFTELLGDQVLEHYVQGEVRGTHFIATSTLRGKVIGLYFS